MQHTFILTDKRVWLVLLLGISLCGCGFALRREKPMPEALKVMYLESSNPYGQISLQLQQILYSIKIKVVDDPAKAPIKLTLFDERTENKTRTKSASAATKEYTLFYQISYSLSDAKGKILYGPKELKTFRNYIVDEDQVLSSTTEQSLLMQEMQRDLVYQLLNQLGSEEVKAAVSVPPHEK